MIRIAFFSIACLVQSLIVGNGFAQNSDKAYSLGREGIALVEQGKIDEGIKLLKQARDLEPGEENMTTLLR